MAAGQKKEDRGGEQSDDSRVVAAVTERRHRGEGALGAHRQGEQAGPERRGAEEGCQATGRQVAARKDSCEAHRAAEVCADLVDHLEKF